MYYKTIKQLLLAIILIFFSLTLFAFEYYTATSELKVRNGAGKKYSVVFTLEKGDRVEVLSKDGSWYKIKYMEQIGYAHSKYLKSISDFESSTTQSSYTNNSGFGILFILLIIGFLWLLPILVIISSSKTTSGEKLAWVLAVIFISWFAWIFYMLLAPIKRKEA